MLQDKKGLSIMIGYVLLIAIAIVMSMIVFQFIRTYVPKDVVDCPDGVSVFIQETEYDCDADTLKVTIKNNGRFSIAGYFIHATTLEGQELATLDLSENMSSGAETYRNSLLFDTGENALPPNDVAVIRFSDVYGIYKIEIIPVRFQEEEGKTRFASCGNAKVSQVLSCWEGICIDGQTQLCPFQDGVCLDSERICVDENWPACYYGSISGYEETETSCEDYLDNDCDGYEDMDDSDCSGFCIDDQTQLCPFQDGVCLNSEQICVGGAWPGCDYTGITGYEETETSCEDYLDNDCDGQVDDDDSDCAPVSSCDGLWEGASEDAGVECDGTPTPESCVDCICEGYYVPDELGGCVLPSDFGCADFCIYLGIYTGGACWPTNQCDPQNLLIYVEEGNPYCPGTPLQDHCCCIP